MAAEHSGLREWQPILRVDSPAMTSPSPAAMISPDELSRLHRLIVQSLPAYLEDLASLVGIDCGSYTKSGVDRVGRWTARFLERLGATVEIHGNPVLGNTVVGTIPGTPGGPRLLLIDRKSVV